VSHRAAPKEAVIPRESGYPVRCGFSIPSLALRNTGSPAFEPVKELAAVWSM
jgi:hypothetical protein